MNDEIIINGVVYVRKGKVSKETQKVMDYFYLDIKKFAERMDISDTKAREISRRKDLCDRGISITTNPAEKGGIRINWIKYVSFVEQECPAVPEYMRIRQKQKEAIS